MTFAVHGLESTKEHGMQVWRHGEGPSVLVLAGPPFSSLLFRHLARPIAQAGWQWVAPELFHPAPAVGGIAEQVDRLLPLLDSDTVLVAHGLALPLARALCERVTPRGLILMDGPLVSLDPVSRVMCRAARTSPSLLAHTVLRPGLLRTVLASSVGLRRAVVNPYVMDRDIVAMLVSPLVASPDSRRAVTEFLASVRVDGSPWAAISCPVLALWGASDLIYPTPAEARDLFPNAAVDLVTLPGARFLHVEEVPGQVVGHMVRWMKTLSSGGTATQMS